MFRAGAEQIDGHVEWLMGWPRGWTVFRAGAKQIDGHRQRHAGVDGQGGVPRRRGTDRLTPAILLLAFALPACSAPARNRSTDTSPPTTCWPKKAVFRAGAEKIDGHYDYEAGKTGASTVFHAGAEQIGGHS